MKNKTIGKNQLIIFFCGAASELNIIATKQKGHKK